MQYILDQDGFEKGPYLEGIVGGFLTDIKAVEKELNGPCLIMRMRHDQWKYLIEKLVPVEGWVDPDTAEDVMTTLRKIREFLTLLENQGIKLTMAQEGWRRDLLTELNGHLMREE